MHERTALTVTGQQKRLDAAMFACCERAGSLYVHVPFCFHKCHYCDFYSVVDSGDRQGEFTDRLIEELRFLSRFAGPLKTIFVGGGTPTLLAAEHWRRLLSSLEKSFDLSAIRAGAGEFTVECNPETATAELMDVLVRGGVNRISVGAQSFDERHLKTLERWHDPASVGRALGLAREAGIARRSVDLIFAIPGQTLREWERDLETALSVDPGLEHLSCYALTYEPRTAMTARLNRGEFAPAEEELEADMQRATVEVLRGAGFERYEVSNFARGEPARSLHNLAYWRGSSWLAAGPSASGHLREGDAGGHRWKNVPNVRAWMAGVLGSGGASVIEDYEGPDARRALVERVMMGLRVSEGLDRAALLEEAGRVGCGTALEGALREQVESGMVEEAGGRVRLTEAGYLFADGVVGELVGGV